MVVPTKLLDVSFKNAFNFHGSAETVIGVTFFHVELKPVKYVFALVSDHGCAD